MPIPPLAVFNDPAQDAAKHSCENSVLVRQGYLANVIDRPVFNRLRLVPLSGQAASCVAGEIYASEQA